MNRTEFIVATAIILFAAFMLGWFASWLIHRLSRVTRSSHVLCGTAVARHVDTDLGSLAVRRAHLDPAAALPVGPVADPAAAHRTARPET